MKKKLNILLIALGISGSIVGAIGFAQKNDVMLPIAAILLVSAGITYGTSLCVKDEKDESEN